MSCVFFVLGSDNHRVRHVHTNSFPTRPSSDRRGLPRHAADAQARSLSRRKGLDLTRNGWVALGNALGVYGNDYLQRAFIAYAGLGALPPEEAIYPMEIGRAHV